MEFPSLGQHCYQSDCKRLDFLPMKCDACSQIFCNDHIHYNTHSCTESYKKDNQVPVCPLCNKPVPVKKGEVADTVVGRHIDNDCQSDPARERRKVYTNRCSKKGCKVKEIVPVHCDKCHKNFCLRHRFEDDHQCQGFEGTGKDMSKQGAAAIRRQQNSSNQTSSNKPKPSNVSAAPQQRNQMASIGRELDRERQQRQQQVQSSRQVTDMRAAQAGLSEEEAFARAIQQSLSETQQTREANSGQNLTQEEEDMLLAQALAASEEESRRQAQRQIFQMCVKMGYIGLKIKRLSSQQQQQQQEKKSCRVS